MQRSDFPTAVCLPCLFSLSGILVSKSSEDLPGCHHDRLASTIGSSTPGVRAALTGCALPGVAFSALERLGTIRQLHYFGAQSRSRQGRQFCHSTSLAFCVRFNAAVARRAATLDTGRLVRPYPGGIRTRLSRHHFQDAPNVPCWPWRYLANFKCRELGSKRHPRGVGRLPQIPPKPRRSIPPYRRSGVRQQCPGGTSWRHPG
jgi:hypothetical protein